MIATAIVLLCIGLVACALIVLAAKIMSLWSSIGSQACDGCTNPTCFRGKECYLLEGGSLNTHQLDPRP